MDTQQLDNGNEYPRNPIHWDDPSALRVQNNYIAKRIAELERDDIVNPETRNKLLTQLRASHEMFTARLEALS
jgi:hypothetical protein